MVSAGQRSLLTVLSAFQEVLWASSSYSNTDWRLDLEDWDRALCAKGVYTIVLTSLVR